MKIEHKAIFLSVIFGLAAWVLDALAGYLLFYRQSFLDNLLLHIHPHEIYHRLVVSVSFLLFGLIWWRLEIERRTLRDSLARQEERWRVMLSNIGDAVMAVDTSSKIVFMNPMAEQLTGWSFSDGQGRPIEQVFHIVNEFTRLPAENIADRVLRDGVVVGLANHTVLITQTGQEIPIDDSAAPIRDTGGSIRGVVLVFRDVTVRRRKEEDLRKSEARYRAMFENMSNVVAVYRTEDDGQNFIFVDFNRAGERIENVSREEVVGQSVLDVFPGLREFGLFDVLKRVWATGQPEHYPVTWYQDDRIAGWRENFVYKLPSGEVVAVYSDETRRRLAEEALKQSEARYRTLFNGNNDGAFVFGLQPGGATTKFIEANEMACLALDYSRQELLNLRPEQVGVWPDSDNNGDLTTKLISDRHVLFETITLGKDGVKKLVEINAHLFYLHDQPAVLATARDITERKQVEQQLRESEERYRTVIESSSDGVVIVEGDTFIFANQRMAEILGHGRPGDILGHKISLFIHPDDRSRVMDYAYRRQQGQGAPSRYDLRALRRDGSIIYVELSAAMIAYYGRPVSLAFIRDITARRQTEESIEQERKRLTVILDGSPVPTFVVGRNRLVMLWNRACEDLTKIPKEKVIGRPVDSRIFYSGLYRPVLADLVLD
ncbi:MAG: PAS domain S-box protein, partial [Deltaproteobacteria bacterium]|nr:PAS domain S-box protein [Deltaproteobacteria bacterium]